MDYYTQTLVHIILNLENEYRSTMEDLQWNESGLNADPWSKPILRHNISLI